MKNEEFKKLSKSEIEMYLLSNDNDKKIHALVRMVDDVGDPEWIQKTLLSYIHDQDFWVAKNAIVGLGDLARVHGKIDLEKVSSELRKIQNERLQGSVDDVFDDFEVFLK